MLAFRLVAVALGLFACLPATAAQLVPEQQELVYTRIKACRAFDTTKTQKIPAASAKSFLISGAGDYAAQGGSSAGCGVPATAQAVSINITAINGAAAGSLTAMAYAQTASTAIIRYPVTAPETVSGTVDLLQNKITLRTTNTVNAIGDITGYYMPQIHGLVFVGGGGSPASVYSGSPALLSVAYVSPGIADVTIDRDITGCTVTTTSFYDRYYYSNAKTQGTNTVRIFSWYIDTQTHLPVSISNNVWLTVHC